MARRRAHRRHLSPALFRKVITSGVSQGLIAKFAGYPDYQAYYRSVRKSLVVDTPLNVERLMRVAEAVNFPPNEVFIDSPAREPK